MDPMAQLYWHLMEGMVQSKTFLFNTTILLFRIMTAGKNKQNLLGLDKEGSRKEEVDTFQTVLETLAPVADISLGDQYSVVLTKSGDIWRIGGEGRVVIKIEIPTSKSYNIGFVAACESLAFFATSDGNVFSFGEKQGNTKLVEFEEMKEKAKKPHKMVKTKDTVVIHFKFV